MSNDDAANPNSGGKEPGKNYHPIVTKLHPQDKWEDYGDTWLEVSGQKFALRVEASPQPEPSVYKSAESIHKKGSVATEYTKPEPPQGELVLKEQLAAIEHERWSDWQRYMHGICSPGPLDGQLIVPAWAVENWKRQYNTPYEQLSHKEKASDMEQVDRYWPLIAQREQEAYYKGREDGEKALEKLQAKIRESGLVGVKDVQNSLDKLRGKE